MLRVRMFWEWQFTDYKHAGQDVGLTEGSLIPKERTELYFSLQSFKPQHPSTQTWLELK